MQQLEVLEPAGARHVGPAAEIRERAVGIDRDGLVVAQLRDPLQLERIVGEPPVRLVAVHDFAHERIVALGHLAHLVPPSAQGPPGVNGRSTWKS